MQYIILAQNPSVSEHDYLSPVMAHTQSKSDKFGQEVTISEDTDDILESSGHNVPGYLF